MLPRLPRLRPSRRWLLVSACLAVALVSLTVWALSEVPARQLSYGQFRSKLVDGQITSVRLARAELTGTLREAEREVAFRTSRQGIEQDPELVSLLARYVPKGRY